MVHPTIIIRYHKYKYFLYTIDQDQSSLIILKREENYLRITLTITTIS